MAGFAPPTGLVDYTTPDGRVISLPGSVADGFVGLTPVTAPVPPVPPPQEPLPLQVPEIAPVDVAPPADPAILEERVPAPEQVAPPVVEQLAPAPPITQQQLVSATGADVYNDASAVIDEQQTASRDVAQVDAREAAATADAQANVARVAEEQQAAIAAAQAETQKWYADKNAEYDAEAKRISETKIDRNLDNPIIAAIGAALVTIGSAMNGGDPQAGSKMLLAAIDRKVAAQMQDLDRRKAGLDTMRGRIGMQRDLDRDRLAQMDQHRIAAIDVARNKIEEVKSRASSQRAIANADVLSADLEAKRADIKASAIERERQRLAAQAAARASARAAQAAAAENARRWQATFDENKRQFDVKEENDLLRAAQKSGLDVKNANEERGIRDPATGQYLLQPKGEEIVKQADAAERQAREIAAAAQSEPDPAKREAMLTSAQAQISQAASAREEAINRFSVRGRNAEQSSKLQNQIADTQTAVSLIDDVVNLRTKHGINAVKTTVADQQIQTKMGVLTFVIKDAFKAGTLDEGLVRAMNKVTGKDPTKWEAKDVRKFLEGSAQDTSGHLYALADALELRARNELAGSYEAAQGYRFRRSKVTKEDLTAADAIREKTPLEEAKAQKRSGALGKTVDAIADNVFLLGSDSVERRRADAVASKGTIYGLTKKQEAAIDAQLAIYAKAKDPEQAARAGDLIVGLASDTTRPELSNALLTKIRGDAPELYAAAVAKLPEDVRADRSKIEATLIESLPAEELGAQARGGNKAALEQLARRGARGDRAAIKVIQTMVP